MANQSIVSKTENFDSHYKKYAKSLIAAHFKGFGYKHLSKEKNGKLSLVRGVLIEICKEARFILSKTKSSSYDHSLLTFLNNFLFFCLRCPEDRIVRPLRSLLQFSGELNRAHRAHERFIGKHEGVKALLELIEREISWVLWFF